MIRVSAISVTPFPFSPLLGPSDTNQTDDWCCASVASALHARDKNFFETYVTKLGKLKLCCPRGPCIKKP